MESKIKFKGKKYLFISNSERTAGAIAITEQYENFEDSFAHLYKDGKVMQYGNEIGTIKDIEFL
jgi:hypothetical protein